MTRHRALETGPVVVGLAPLLAETMPFIALTPNPSPAPVPDPNPSPNPVPNPSPSPVPAQDAKPSSVPKLITRILGGLGKSPRPRV